VAQTGYALGKLALDLFDLLFEFLDSLTGLTGGLLRRSQKQLA
jgi:hypothetical protein